MSLSRLPLPSGFTVFAGWGKRGVPSAASSTTSVSSMRKNRHLPFRLYHDLPRELPAAWQLLSDLTDQVAGFRYKGRQRRVEPLCSPYYDGSKCSRARDTKVEQGIRSRFDHMDPTPASCNRFCKFPSKVPVWPRLMGISPFFYW